MRRIITRHGIVKCLRGMDLDRTNPTMLGRGVYTGYRGEHCIVGELLVRHGYPLPDITNPLNSADPLPLMTALGVKLTSEALLVINDLHLFADDGVTWADAVALSLGDLETAA